MTDGQGHAEGEDAPTPVAITPRSPWPSSQEQVTGDLASFGRTLLLAVLGGGALFVTIVTLADVLVRRKDLDRRRPWRHPRRIGPPLRDCQENGVSGLTVRIPFAA